MTEKSSLIRVRSIGFFVTFARVKQVRRRLKRNYGNGYRTIAIFLANSSLFTVRPRQRLCDSPHLVHCRNRSFLINRILQTVWNVKKKCGVSRYCIAEMQKSSVGKKAKKQTPKTSAFGVLDNRRKAEVISLSFEVGIKYRLKTSQNSVNTVFCICCRLFFCLNFCIF